MMSAAANEDSVTTVFQLQEQMQQGAAPLILDVREPDEFTLCHIAGAQSMPLLEVPTRFSELDPTEAIVVCCHTGNKSLEVVKFLRRREFQQVSNLEGGIDLWALAVDRTFPIYGRDPEKSNAFKQTFWERVEKLDAGTST